MTVRLTIGAVPTWFGPHEKPLKYRVTVLLMLLPQESTVPWPRVRACLGGWTGTEWWHQDPHMSPSGVVLLWLNPEVRFDAHRTFQAISGLLLTKEAGLMEARHALLDAYASQPSSWG